ncbi:MAG: aldo/keto reductase, partial [Lawsonibacter sp.]
METIKLGRTDLEVTRLSLGGLFMSDLVGDFEKSRIATQYALDTGVRLIDTAPSYFNSETVLGNILKSYEGENKPLISTKLGMPEPWSPKSRADIFASVESSMEKLGIDHIDILFIHEPERRLQMDWWDSETTYDGPVMECLEELKAKGLIRHTG